MQYLWGPFQFSHGLDWLDCDGRGYHFWIHGSCYGFQRAEDDTFENIDFFCKKHVTVK